MIRAFRRCTYLLFHVMELRVGCMFSASGMTTNDSFHVPVCSRMGRLALHLYGEGQRIVPTDHVCRHCTQENQHCSPMNLSASATAERGDLKGVRIGCSSARTDRYSRSILSAQFRPGHGKLNSCRHAGQVKTVPSRNVPDCRQPSWLVDGHELERWDWMEMGGTDQDLGVGYGTSTWIVAQPPGLTS